MMPQSGQEGTTMRVGIGWLVSIAAGGMLSAGCASKEEGPPLTDCSAVDKTVGQVDLQTTTKHCGACGHDCEFGTCAGGVCKPGIFAKEQDGAWAMTSDDGNLYWTTSGGGTVMKAAKAGGPVELAKGQKKPQGIAIDATGVYWTQNDTAGAVMEIAKAGGAAPVKIADDQSTLGVAVDVTSVYFTATGGRIVKAPLSAGLPSDLAKDQATPCAMVANSNYLFWVNQGSGSDGAIMKLGIASGGTPSPLASGLQRPSAIAIDATDAYVASKGGILKIPLATGGTPTTLAPAGGTPEGIAIDDSDVYWANPVEGTVMRVSKKGGAAVTVASAQKSPTALAVDAKAIWWTCAAPGKDGAVMKLVR
jgi:hypothetical protein